MMPNPREPQPVAGQQPYPPAYPPGYQQQPYAAPNPYYAPPAPPPTGGRFSRTVRLVFHRWLRLNIQFFRWIGSRIGWVLTILALLGVLAWVSSMLIASRQAAPPDPRAAMIAPSAATEAFLSGKQSYNAEQIWSSYSTTYQTAQLQRGFSKENLRLQVETERTRGLKYSQFEYIGGSTLDGGGGLYYYTVQLELQGQQLKIPVVFTVDTDGKIARVSSPLMSQEE